MRALLVLDGLWVGGTERSMAELAEKLATDSRHDVEFAVLRSRDEGVEQYVRDLGIPIHVVGPGLCTAARSLRALVRRLEPDVVHSALFQANVVSRLALLGLRLPLINSIVSMPYSRQRLSDPSVKRARARIVQAIDIITGKMRVDLFHAVSESAAIEATRAQRISASRIRVVHRGRDPRRFVEPTQEHRRWMRRTIGVPESATVMITVGRQDYPKAHADMLSALEEARASGLEVVLVMAGRRGSASKMLDAMIDRAQLGEYVFDIGHSHEIPALLAAADIFVLASRYEGFPGAVLEAMAAGLPVIATGIPANREMVTAGATGILTDPGDRHQLASAMSTLAQDAELRRRLGTGGAKRFHEEFTQDRSTARMLDLYKEAIRSRD